MSECLFHCLLLLMVSCCLVTGDCEDLDAEYLLFVQDHPDRCERSDMTGGYDACLLHRHLLLDAGLDQVFFSSGSVGDLL